VGRPNVGKSTIMNAMLGQKLSIVTPKPQTTRQSILGIKTVQGGQILFLDTPGIHLGGKRAINRHMNRAALSVLDDVDVVLFVVESARWTAEDDNVLRRIAQTTTPCMLALNKIDLLPRKSQVLPLLADRGRGHDYAAMIPISAKKGDGLVALEAALLQSLPLSRPQFDEDQLTDRSERFLASEIVREQLTRRLHQELPYALTVETEHFERRGELLAIGAIIWVEKNSQKAMVIGKGGQNLKRIGSQARPELETLFGCKVFLQLWSRPIAVGLTTNGR